MKCMMCVVVVSHDSQGAVSGGCESDCVCACVSAMNGEPLSTSTSSHASVLVELVQRIGPHLVKLRSFLSERGKYIPSKYLFLWNSVRKTLSFFVRASSIVPGFITRRFTTYRNLLMAWLIESNRPTRFEHR